MFYGINRLFCLERKEIFYELEIDHLPTQEASIANIHWYQTVI